MTDKVKTYVADRDVYVEQQYFKAGVPFATSDKPGEGWDELKPAEAQAISASVEQVPADAPLEELGVEALRAVAVTKHVNVAGMSKKQLIDAIKAADEPRL